MGIQFRFVRINDICDSKPSGFGDDLLESISTYGLLQPLTVYPLDSSESKYAVVSGHKRLGALKELARKDPGAIVKVPCFVIPEPSDHELDRLYYESNRQFADDENLIKDLVLSAALEWDDYPAEERKRRMPDLMQQFSARMDTDDPLSDKKYRADNFRPKLEYIRLRSGKELSYRQIKKLIKATEE